MARLGRSRSDLKNLVGAYDTWNLCLVEALELMNCGSSGVGIYELWILRRAPAKAVLQDVELLSGVNSS